VNTSQPTWICQQCSNIYPGQSITGVCSTCVQTRMLLAQRTQDDAAARARADEAVKAQQQQADAAREAAARAELRAQTYALSARSLADVEREVRKLRRAEPTGERLQVLLRQRDRLALLDAANVEPAQRVSLTTVEDEINTLVTAYTQALGARAERAIAVHEARASHARLVRLAAEEDKDFVRYVEDTLTRLAEAADRGLDVSSLLTRFRSLRGAPVGEGRLDDAAVAELQALHDALVADWNWQEEARLVGERLATVEEADAAVAAHRAAHGGPQGPQSAFWLQDDSDGWVERALNGLNAEHHALLEPTLRSLQGRVRAAQDMARDRGRIVVPTTSTPLGSMQSVYDARGENGVNGLQAWEKIWETGKHRAATPAGALVAARALQEAVELAIAGRVPGWSGGAAFGLLFASLIPGLLVAETPLKDISGLVIMGLWAVVGRGAYVRWRWLNDVAANVYAVQTFSRQVHKQILELGLDALMLRSALTSLKLASGMAHTRAFAHDAVAAAARQIEAAQAAANHD
jgi:hypothetical protein